MKLKLNVGLLVIAMVFITGCKPLDRLTQFNMDYHETVVIPASTGINLPFNLFTPNVKTNAENTFAVNDTRKDMVEEIRLEKLELTVQEPANGDFSFVKSIEIFLTAPGLPEERVAWKENVSADAGNVLVLETTAADLKEYIKQETFTLKLSTVTDEFLTSDHKIDVFSSFFVNAKVLGK